MNFIRDNILKIIIIIIVIFLFIFGLSACSKFSAGKPASSKYEEMENKLKEAAIKFTKENTRYLPQEVNESSKLNMRILVTNDKLAQFYANEDSSKACTGYVSITKKSEGTYSYVPFIKCGKYYETMTLSNYIKENDKVVTSDDGLYNYNNTLVYRGERAKNNLVINQRPYRIVSISENGEVRVVDTKKYTDRNPWDDRYNNTVGKEYGINIFEKSRLKDYLNSYYETDNEYFTDYLRSVIVPHDICVGPVPKDNSDFSGNVECQVVSENQYIGLLQANEYFRASIDSNCKTINNYECGNYNYMMNINQWSIVTQNPTLENSYQVLSISDGRVNYIRASSSFNIYLTFYLDANVLYNSGDGTVNNPYTLRW